ncbi:MAG: hypothetical protein AAB592_04785 [Patescibacteria group bacterium]
MAKEKESKEPKKNSQHVIYVEIDDEITSIFDRIKKLPRNAEAKKILLVVPRRAILLQSVVNLRILKKKLESKENPPRLVIVTNDKSGILLATQAGIEVIEKIQSTPALKTLKTKSDSSHQSLLSATANRTETLRPTRLPEKKVPLGSFLKRGDGGTVDRVTSTFKKWLRNRQKKNQSLPQIVIVAPNKQALVTFVIATVLVFLIIAYVALPGATIYLTPESNRVEQSINVIFADFTKNRDALGEGNAQMITSYPIIPPPTKKTIIYHSTGKESRGNNAQGTITVINESPRERQLIAKTRFQTDEGIVFRITQDITIPALSGINPGKVEVNAVADPFDVNGMIVGERGNIGPTRFFIPGLQNEENRKTLYGQNYQPVTGGTTEVTKTVRAEDLEAARKQAELEIIDQAKIDLRAFLERQNQERNTGLILIPDSRAVTVGTPRITIPTNLESAPQESFEVLAEVTIIGVAYNPDELVKILERELRMRQSPDKRIVGVEATSVTYKIVEINEDTGRIKVTGTIRGIEEFEIRPEKESGTRLIKKIKDHIVGKSINEATLFIQNLAEIDHVEIKSWPFWAPNIPAIPDHIKVVITGPGI